MKYFVYLSVADEDKVSIFSMDSEHGKLTFREDVTTPGGPGPLAADPRLEYLYAGIRSTRKLSTFRIDHASGGLSPIDTVSLPSDPCFLTTDRTGRFLLSSYYKAGRAAVHPIGGDGVAGEPTIEWIPTAEKAHSIQTDPSNRFAFVPHTAGPNLIFQFEFNQNTGALKPNAVPRVIPEDGSGPRHFCFHPEKDILYFSNEQGCSVTAYHFDPDAGVLSPFQTIPTLPKDFDGDNVCAQIKITPSGSFLYVSNRGHDSIACFSIDSATGGLTSIGQQPTEKVPRAFNLDPEGNFLFAAGQGSGNLASYRIDPVTGILTPLEIYTVGENPMWVLVLKLRG